jgi:hypothetical protein
MPVSTCAMVPKKISIIENASNTTVSRNEEKKLNNAFM